MKQNYKSQLKVFRLLDLLWPFSSSIKSDALLKQLSQDLLSNFTQNKNTEVGLVRNRL